MFAGRGFWFVSRFEDVVAVLRDDRFVRCPVAGMTPEPLVSRRWKPDIFKPLDHMLMKLDPPDHTRLRALVQQAFMPRTVERLRGRIQTLCNDLIDAAEPNGSIDLVAEYA